MKCENNAAYSSYSPVSCKSKWLEKCNMISLSSLSSCLLRCFIFYFCLVIFPFSFFVVFMYRTLYYSWKCSRNILKCFSKNLVFCCECLIRKSSFGCGKCWMCTFSLFQCFNSNTLSFWSRLWTTCFFYIFLSLLRNKHHSF